ncbi:hypothetical protein SE19_08135 [Acidiplasma aeolicum]|uniref:Uncharacterized protein n=3 Tax=Ferroplasmaceae TaxID=90142 RepID=A0A0N8VLI4_9ARCH|nr:hypothetical protein TZ01_02175 [Acidiplasma sp. MBA-1]KPV45837.1 hypothetical protein SE19_08135 [Acidiplasma aeolicum]KQB35590.1 hypothetical protein AOG54_00500 [Acidiplasma aeolicum]KQB36612.1 hypothetical protein AOG55_03565 [Acidiplasma cupricumulans]
MDEKTRKSETALYINELLQMNQNEIEKIMRDMIIEMRKATDENYVNFCITVFKVISEMDGDKIRDYLNLRVKANMDLPEMIRDRDLKMMEKALAAAPDDVIQKISKYMPNF